MVVKLERELQLEVLVESIFKQVIAFRLEFLHVIQTYQQVLPSSTVDVSPLLA